MSPFFQKKPYNKIENSFFYNFFFRFCFRLFSIFLLPACALLVCVGALWDRTDKRDAGRDVAFGMEKYCTTFPRGFQRDLKAFFGRG